MNHTTTLALAFLFIASSSLFAQDLGGRKIVNGNLTFNLTKPQYSNPITTVNSSVLFGKIKADNTYWAFGGAFTLTALGNDYSNHSVEVGPAIERGKFLKLIDQLYLAPYFGGSIKGQFGFFNGINLNAYVSPIRFMYHFKENFMFTAGFGSANLGFTANDAITSVSLNASLDNNSGFGVFYTFK